MLVVRRRRRWPWVLIIAILVIYVGWCLFRPLPKLTAVISEPPFPAKPVTNNLNWPANGQAAVGILDSSIIEAHGSAQLPTASTAKLITVLTVLQQKPLAIGQTGPTITLGQNDVALYKNYAAHGGSDVLVAAGEQISEYQMLQAILLPSANNMADSLAIWAFGSLPAYKTAAQTYLNQHSLTGTDLGTDASGYAPSTTSTAHDLVRLGELAMQNPVIGQIVSQPAASLPIAGTVKNVNWLLGTDNIIGVKTGNTDQAGGVYIAASRVTVNQRPLTIVTAVLGSTTLANALKDSLALMQSAQTHFPTTEIIKAKITVGAYKPAWSNQTIAAKTTGSVALQTWNGTAWNLSPSLRSIDSKAMAGKTVGHVTVSANGQPTHYDVTVKLATSVPKPTTVWRLQHPF